MAHLTLNHFLVISALLFGFGLLAVVTRRNAVAVLMGIELILNAANLNLVAFGRYVAGGVSGQVFGLAIYQMSRSIDTSQATTLKE